MLTYPALASGLPERNLLYQILIEFLIVRNASMILYNASMTHPYAPESPNESSSCKKFIENGPTLLQ